MFSFVCEDSTVRKVEQLARQLGSSRSAVAREALRAGLRLMLDSRKAAA